MDSDGVGELEIAKNRCVALRDRVSQTLRSEAKLTDSCRGTLLRLVNAELRFLSRISSAPASTNLGYLESVVRILDHPSVTKVSRLCKPVPSLTPPVHVDIICTIGSSPAWVLVSDRNPKFVSWLGSLRDRGLRAKVEHVVGAAKLAGSMKPESIFFFFCSGVTDGVFERMLEEFGASEVSAEFLGTENGAFEEVEDGWVNVNFRKSRAFEIKIESMSLACGVGNLGTRQQRKVSVGISSGLSSDDVFCSLVSTLRMGPMEELTGGLVNFDTTALIALVSGISNGGAKKLIDAPEDTTRKQFKGNYRFVMGQAESELQMPILKELQKEIAGNRGMICTAVQLEFKELITMFGGEKEKWRADHLLKHIKFVPNCPSARMAGLPTTRKIAMKNKIVFGTGDYWRAPTLTANMGFVRAISQSGISLLTTEHRPRSLIGD